MRRRHWTFWPMVVVAVLGCVLFCARKQRLPEHVIPRMEAIGK